MQSDLVFRMRLRLDLHHDFAMISELDRVSDKIHHDLAQPQRITNERLGKIRMNAARQLNPFLVRTRRKYAHGVFEFIAEVETDTVELQFARLDLRKVEKVVHQCKQR